MSDTHWKIVRQPQTALVLILVCLFIISVSFIGTVAAQSEQSKMESRADRTVTGTAPVVVFQGESVDISRVHGTTGSKPGNRAGLVGLSGSADGNFYQDSSRNFDFDRVEPGTYDLDRDRNTDVIVRKPEIERIRLHRGSTTDGINITNGRISPSQDQINVQVHFNFESSAENVTVSVINPDGLDITRELTTNPSLSADEDVIRLSNISSLERGQFRVKVSGTGKFESTTHTVRFDREREPMEISLQTSSVAQGTIVNGSVTGNAGEQVQVRVPKSATKDGVTADQVFESLNNVVYLTDQPTLGGQGYHTAVIGIGSSGRETIQIDTQRFRINQVISISAAEGTNLENRAISEASVEITSPSITVESSPNVVVLGNQFQITGTGPDNGIIRAYVKDRYGYVPLKDVSGNPVELKAQSNGKYNLSVVATQPMEASGSYDIIITGSDENDGNSVLSPEEYQDIELRAVIPVHAQESNLTATLSTNWTSTNGRDTVTISGYTTGSSIRLYIVDPQGTVRNASGAPVRQPNEAEVLTLMDGMFTEQITMSNSPGEYQIFVVSAPDSADWDTADSTEINDYSSREAIRLIKKKYAGDNLSFSTVTLYLRANASQLTIETPRDGEQLSPGNITVRGQSNREDGHNIFIEILDQNQRVLDTETVVNGRTNTWQTMLNVSALRPGSYTIRVNDGISTTSAKFNITGPSTDTDVPTDSTPGGIEPTTSAAGPGFTVLSLVIAFVAFIIITRRKYR